MTRDIDMLIVEDNPVDAELIVKSLKGGPSPERVHLIDDGEEALDFLFCRNAYAERVSLGPPRVVVLDIKLPKIDGFEVLRAIRLDRRTKPIPVVMLTSSNVHRDVQTALELGANSFIQKPVDYVRFREVVRKLGEYWLSLNEPMPPSAFAIDS